MSDLREQLEREAERVTLAPGAAERMFERGRRRERARRMAALVVGLVVFAAVLVVVGSSLPGGDRTPEPATPTPSSPGDVAGSYTTSLPIGDPAVERFGVNGTYTLRLGADGSMELSAPRRSDLPGEPIAFDVEHGRFTTDLFVGAPADPWLSYAEDLGEGCDAIGVYRVTIGEETLSLVPTDDSCALRSALLSTRPWVVAEADPDATTDRLEGDWVSTFSCARMVDAVERAPVSEKWEAWWARMIGRELGSDDPRDPCSGEPGPLSHTFRFDDGRLQIFTDASEGFDGAYEVRGDVVEIRDATGRNINGRYRFHVDLEEDVMTIDLLGRGGRDPFFVGTWESAPLIRSSG